MSEGLLMLMAAIFAKLVMGENQGSMGVWRVAKKSMITPLQTLIFQPARCCMISLAQLERGQASK